MNRWLVPAIGPGFAIDSMLITFGEVFAIFCNLGVRSQASHRELPELPCGLIDLFGLLSYGSYLIELNELDTPQPSETDPAGTEPKMRNRK
jgi:hypothetical protein